MQILDLQTANQKAFVNSKVLWAYDADYDYTNFRRWKEDGKKETRCQTECPTNPGLKSAHDLTHS